MKNAVKHDIVNLLNSLPSVGVFVFIAQYYIKMRSDKFCQCVLVWPRMSLQL